MSFLDSLAIKSHIQQQGDVQAPGAVEGVQEDVHPGGGIVVRRVAPRSSTWS